MIHDQALLDFLSGAPQERFDGIVFRATGARANPAAPSANGGRWASRTVGQDPGVSVLYTSLEEDGAAARSHPT